MARILVIDDAVSILDWLASVLLRAGHEVLIAENPNKGLKRLRETAVDLVITDIYMPDTDGLEVIQQARKLAPGIKIIAMSTRPPGRNMFAAARALGAVHALRKPFTEEKLLEVVSGVLRIQISPTAANSPRQREGGVTSVP
jgi:DNA-binding NtrC family response regulator